jgi:hypothetical protein
MLKRVSIASLQVGGGGGLSSPIRDDDGTKLIGTGVKVTERMLERLRERGIESAMIDERDLSHFRRSNAPPTSPRQDRKRSPSTPKSSEDIGETPSPISKATGVSPVGKAPRCSWESMGSGQLDEAIERAVQQSVAALDHPFVENVQEHRAEPYDPEMIKRFAKEQRSYLDELTPFLIGLAEE